MKRIWKPVIGLFAVIYFLVDAVLLPVAARISSWVGEHWMFCRLRNWIVSLRPYPTLLLFAIPVVLLEPVKPFAVYLAGTGHMRLGAIVFVIGELLKLVLVERLFSLSRDKLMSIPAFAWGYGKYRAAQDWVVSLEAWQNARRWTRIAQYKIRRTIRELRNPRLSEQSQ